MKSKLAAVPPLDQSIDRLTAIEQEKLEKLLNQKFSSDKRKFEQSLKRKFTQVKP
jgi:hypothetical protein